MKGRIIHHDVPLAARGVDQAPDTDLILGERGKGEHDDGVVFWTFRNGTKACSTRQ